MLWNRLIMHESQEETCLILNKITGLCFLLIWWSLSRIDDKKQTKMYNSFSLWHLLLSYSYAKWDRWNRRIYNNQTLTPYCLRLKWHTPKNWKDLGKLKTISAYVVLLKPSSTHLYMTWNSGFLQNWKFRNLLIYETELKRDINVSEALWSYIPLQNFEFVVIPLQLGMQHTL